MTAIQAIFHFQPANRRLAWLWVLVCAIPLVACGGDAEYQRVDFGPQMADESAAQQSDALPRMPVAVAAMISPKETFIHYRELIDYLMGRLGYEAELVQRKTYGEVNEMLGKGLVDLAFICTGPYVVDHAAGGFEAIATPVVRGEPFYRSYLIVHRDSEVNALMDLRGRDFAFTDPESNTGTFVPRHWLKRMGETPETFFRSVTYTYSHDNSILAVAKKLVAGATVDGHIWDFYQQQNARHTSQTRVIEKSDPYGSPPVVVSSRMAPDLKAALGKLILNMHDDPEGRRILSRLHIERFTVPEQAWYSPVTEMLVDLGVARKNSHGQ